MIAINESKHLTKEEQIVLGSYYTPQKLVNEIHKNITPFILKKETKLHF